MTKEKTKKLKTLEQKNIISVGVFKLFNKVINALIKFYGAIFIYTNSRQISHIFLFLIVYSLVQIISNQLFSKLFSNHPKLSLILGIIPSLMMFSVFFVSLNALWFTLIISVSNGLMNSFYFAPIYVINGSLESSGETKTQSIIQSLEYLGSIITIIISGFLLDSINTKYVALMGIALYFVATVVFFFTYNYKNKKVDTKGAENNLITSLEKFCISEEIIEIVPETPTMPQKNKFNPFKNYYPWLTEALVGVVTLLDVLLRVYAYIHFSSFAMVGIMNAVIATSSLLGTIIIGRYSTKHTWGKLTFIAVILTSLIWIVRPFAANEILFFCLSLLSGFLMPLIIVPLDSTYYCSNKNKSKKLVQKDLFRKLFIVPYSLICFAIASLPASIILMGGMLGLTSIQVIPASKLYEKKLSLETIKNNMQEDKL